MNKTSTQVMTVRLPTVVAEAAQQEAERRSMTVSELVRTALLTLLELDPPVRRHATILYEIAKTRAVLLRLLDTQLTKAQVDKLLALAEDDATNYVSERLGGENGTV